MVINGQYADPIIACTIPSRGTAICHTNGACSVCDFAKEYEAEKYIKSQSEVLECSYEVSKLQLQRISRDIEAYGVPICLCKAYVEGLIELEDVSCPCKEASKDIAEKGKCKCGVFRRLEQ